MKFLGIDFGWRSQPSGLCCLEWCNEQLSLLDLDRKAEIADILEWVERWLAPSSPGMIAVDAPTLIPNVTGMREADRLTHKYFGRYHAGCYPANLSRPFAQRTLSFGKQLEAQGFVHAPEITPQQLGRYQIEVFPHPAIVQLFGLQRILKYKKGRLWQRQLELEKLLNFILDVLPHLQPRLNLEPNRQKLEIPPLPAGGAALKATEDQLDSLICAYVGAHWWYWGLERNCVLGDLTTGYIVVPVTSVTIAL